MQTATQKSLRCFPSTFVSNLFSRSSCQIATITGVDFGDADLSAYVVDIRVAGKYTANFVGYDVIVQLADAVELALPDVVPGTPLFEGYFLSEKKKKRSEGHDNTIGVLSCVVRIWIRITKTGQFLLRVKNLCASKNSHPVLVILMHPKAYYAGKHILLRWHRRNMNRSCYAHPETAKISKNGFVTNGFARFFAEFARYARIFFFPYAVGSRNSVVPP